MKSLTEFHTGVARVLTLWNYCGYIVAILWRNFMGVEFSTSIAAHLGRSVIITVTSNVAWWDRQHGV